MPKKFKNFIKKNPKTLMIKTYKKEIHFRMCCESKKNPHVKSKKI